jgi:hypothetical protein
MVIAAPVIAAPAEIQVWVAVPAVTVFLSVLHLRGSQKLLLSVLRAFL